MKKYGWLIAVVGMAVLGIALVSGAAFGAGIAYFFLQADPVQAAFAAPVEPDHEAGVLISGIKSDSAAAEAGLVRGDIILEVDGEPVNNMLEMKTFLAELQPGAIVELTVLHGDEIRNLTAELDDADGLAFLGVGTCDFSKSGEVFPGGLMGDDFIEVFPLGAEIMEVVPEGPAQAAGLQAGDLILSVNEITIGPEANLADLIKKYAPGDTVILEVLSGLDEEPQEVEVTLGEHPDNPEQAYLGVAYQSPQVEIFPFVEMPEEFEGERPEGWGEGDEFYYHGMPFEGEESLPHFFDLGELPEGINGAVIVSEVMEDTPAAEVGLQPGDLITAVDGAPVAEIETFVEEMQSRKPGDEVALTIIRASEETEVTVTLAEHPDDPDKGFLGVLAGTLAIIEEMDLPEGFEQDFEFKLPGVPGGDA